MANRDSAPPGNGTFWSSIMAGYEYYFRSREAESSTATAATTRASPRPRFPPSGVEFDQAWRQGPLALEAFLDHQISNYRDGPRYRLPSSSRESAEYIHNSIADYQRDVGRDVGSESTFHNSIADYERGIGGDVISESTLAAEPPNGTPNAVKYLSKLQPIAVNDLPEDSRICAICKESYNSDEHPEQACKIGPCGHVLGQTCLSTWVMPAGSRPNTTCPLCRAVLFKDDTPDPSEDFDDEDELDEEVYEDTAVRILDRAILDRIFFPSPRSTSLGRSEGSMA